jgi:hypothetical protein
MTLTAPTAARFVASPANVVVVRVAPTGFGAV